MSKRQLFSLFGSIAIEGIGRSKKELTEFNKEVRGATKRLNKLGRDVVKTGQSMTKNFTVPISLLAGAVTKFGADFDSAMTKSISIMGDLSDAMRDEMEMAARSVAKTTKYSAAEAAEAYFFLASAGLDAVQSIEALPRVAALAQAGNFNLAQATDLLTDAQSALGLASDDAAENMANMTRVSDVLVEANKMANASVEQFSSALTQKAANALRSVNKEIEEGVSVLAVYADQGIKGERAGTMLSASIDGLTRAADTNASEFQRLGIRVFDAQGNMRSFADIITDVEQSIGDMSTQQQRAELSALGLNRQTLNGVLALQGNSDALRDYEEQLKNAGGATDEVAKKQLQDFYSQMGLLKDRIVDVGLTLWQSLEPVITGAIMPAMDALIKQITALANWFNELPEGVRDFAVVFGLVLAAMGPVVVVAGKLMLALRSLIPLKIALTKAQHGLNLAMTANPIGIVIASITALVTAGILLYKNWDKVTRFMGAAWDAVTFQVEQGSLLMQEVWAKAVISIIDGIRRITDYLPGVSDKIFDARDAMEDLMFTVQNKRKINDIERKQLIEQRNAQQEATDATIEATDATREMNDATGEEAASLNTSTSAKRQNTQAQKNLTGERYRAIDAVVAVHNALEEAKEAAKQQLEERARFEEQWSEKLFRETNNRIAILEYEKQQALQQAHELGAEEADIKAYYLNKIEGAKKKEAEASVRATRQEVQEKISLMQQLHSGVSAIMRDLSNMRMIQMENEIEKRRQQIESSVMGEEEKEEALTELEAEAAERKEELQKKEAKRNKVLRLFEIGINTAAAVAKALPNLVLAGIVGTMGAAQAAIVAATPIPLARGGLVQSDPGRGVVAQIGEGSQDEIVMPLQTGIDQIVSGLISRLQNISMPRPAFAGAAGGGGDVNLNIGTLIADERGIKNLERRMAKYRIRENQRTGR